LTKLKKAYWLVLISIFIAICATFLISGTPVLADNTTISTANGSGEILPGVVLPLPTENTTAAGDNSINENGVFILPLPTPTPVPTETTEVPEVVNSSQETIAQNSTPQNSVMSGPNYVTGNYVPNQTMLPYYPGVMHILNGQCVPLNATIDISSLGWGVPEISYYGLWYRGFNAENISDEYDISLPDTPSALSNYYLDPAVFGNKFGFWFENYVQQSYILSNGEVYNPEESGNDRMFYLNLTCPPPPNYTFLQAQQTTVNVTPQPSPFLSLRKTSDMVLAVGDKEILNVTTPNHWWLFGYLGGQQILDQADNDISSLTLDSSNWNITTGDYDLEVVNPEIISPSNTSIYEEKYVPDYPSGFSSFPAIISPFRNSIVKNILGLNPQNIDDDLHEMVTASFGNNITTYHIEYEQPYVTIEDLDIITNQTNYTWMNVRGYTDMADGTPVALTLDQGVFFKDLNNTHMFAAQAMSSDPGVLREYNALFPIDLDNIWPGPHNITAMLPGGQYTSVQFYRYIAPPANYIPPQHITYMGASPFIPPVTVTVTVPVPGPTQYVDRPIPPTEQQINDAAWKIVGNETMDAIGALIICALVFATGRFLYRVHMRRKWQKP